VGFFVADGTLYDANGVAFQIRGVNQCHYDFSPDIAYASMNRARANTVRIALPIWMEQQSVDSIQAAIDNELVPMPGVWAIDGWGGPSVTCEEDASLLSAAVDQWIARYDVLKPFERSMLLNIANEWGPGDSDVWRDSYIEAVTRLRSQGYLCTIVVDAGGCGQDPTNLMQYAQAVFDADPQHNVVFSIHIYGAWASFPGETYDGGWPKPFELPGDLDALAGLGLPVIVGEFGPGRNIGPSPSTATPSQVIAAADANNFGWLAWAWDDNPGAGDNWFSLTTNLYYSPATSAEDLTLFGQDVVEDPTQGLRVAAEPATIF